MKALSFRANAVSRGTFFFLLIISSCTIHDIPEPTQQSPKITGDPITIIDNCDGTYDLYRNITPSDFDFIIITHNGESITPWCDRGYGYQTTITGIPGDEICIDTDSRVFENDCEWQTFLQ